MRVAVCVYVWPYVCGCSVALCVCPYVCLYEWLYVCVRVRARLSHTHSRTTHIQVYKLKEANRKLRERLTQVELDHAKAY